MTAPPRLCVFARSPVPGKVKRRLATRLGPAGALAAHERLVTDTLARLSGLSGVRAELWIAGPVNATVCGWLDRYGVVCHAQQGHDLGARMHHALAHALSRSERAVLVGSDCPDIDAAYVCLALERLHASDVVLGPAEDGGYGLIGVRRGCQDRLEELFTGVPWGGSEVLATTRRRVRDAGYQLAELNPIWDVDTYDDWQRYLARPQRPG